MGHLHGSVHIDAPIEHAFDVALDITLMPEYMRAVKDMSPPSGPPEAKGTTYRFHSSFLGRDMDGTVEVLEARRPTFLRTLTTYGNGTRVTWTQRFVETADGTDEVDDIDYALPPGRAWALFDPLVGRQLERAAHESVPRYVALVRARAAGTR